MFTAHVSPKDRKRQMSEFAKTIENQRSKLIPTIEFSLSLAFLEAAIWVQTIAWRTFFIIAATFFFARCLVLYAIPTWKNITEYRIRHSFGAKKESSIWHAGIVVFASVVLAVLLAFIFYAVDLWSPVQLRNVQRTAIDWLVVKIPTVIIQQLVFQLIVVPTAYFLTQSVRSTVLISSFAFALLHLPNPLLMLLTACIGLIWFSLIFRFKSLIPITLSHLVLALAVGNIAEEFVFDMRVGSVCFQKWPYKITTADSSNEFSVYPRLLHGDVELVTQCGNQIEFIGKAFDRDRNKPPFEVLVVFGSFDSTIEPTDAEFSDASKQNENWNPQRIVSVKTDPSDGRFRFTLANNNQKLETEVRLFARHRNGWAYPIHGSTRLTSYSTQQTAEKICLHPLECEANIGHLKQRENRIDAIGWGFSSESRELIDEVLVHSEDGFIVAKFQRRPRHEIARTFNDDSILNCGMVIRLDSKLNLIDNAVYVRNSRGMLERLPQRLQHRAKPSDEANARMSKKSRKSSLQ